MKFQRQPTSFVPKPLKKKGLGPRMMKIANEVQRSTRFMTLNAPYRNTGANRGDDVENIGCARNGKTYDSAKSARANEGQDRRKFPLRDNLAMSNGNIVPLGKSKQFAVSSSMMDFKKSMPSSFKDVFSLKVPKKRALQALKDNSSDRNRIVRGLLSSVEAPLVLNKGHDVASIQGNAIVCRVHVDEHHKEQFFKEKEHKNPSSKSKCCLGTRGLQGNLDKHRRIKTPFMGNTMKRNGNPPAEDSRTENGKFKSKRKAPVEKMQDEHANDIEEAKTIRVKRRKLILTDDDDDISGNDQNITTVGDGTGVLSKKTSIVEQYGSLPVDEPIWSGMLKITEGYVSLEAHLLAKSCEKVWECSRSLEKMVEVTKLSRLESEPKCFRVSSPTEDNIGLYFFPQGMRPNEDFDKLVKEVMDNDLILRATLDEAEMLIFPSILLPERHQTFQGKHYLWGLFKRREDKVSVQGEHMRGTCLSGHEKENGKQPCSRHCVSEKSIDKEQRTASLARSNTSMRPAGRAAIDIATPAPAAIAATSHAPSSTRPAERPAAEAGTRAPAAMSHAPSSIRPAERFAAEAATPAPAATTSDAPSSAVPHSGMFGFIVQQTPRIQQLLEEMAKEGAMVFAMRGETIGDGLVRQ